MNAPSLHTDDFISLKEGTKRLREEGYKITPQRLAILELFDVSPKHRTPQEIFNVLEGVAPGLSRATVYNNLDVFAELGLLSKVLAEDGQTYYDPNLTTHYHAVCTGCSDIFDVEVDVETLASVFSVASPDGARLKRVMLWFEGRCKGCDEKSFEQN